MHIQIWRGVFSKVQRAVKNALIDVDVNPRAYKRGTVILYTFIHAYYSIYSSTMLPTNLST